MISTFLVLLIYFYWYREPVISTKTVKFENDAYCKCVFGTVFADVI